MTSIRRQSPQDFCHAAERSSRPSNYDRLSWHPPEPPPRPGRKGRLPRSCRVAVSLQRLFEARTRVSGSCHNTVAPPRHLLLEQDREKPSLYLPGERLRRVGKEHDRDAIVDVTSETRVVVQPGLSAIVRNDGSASARTKNLSTVSIACALSAPYLSWEGRTLRTICQYCVTKECAVPAEDIASRAA